MTPQETTTRWFLCGRRKPTAWLSIEPPSRFSVNQPGSHEGGKVSPVGVTKEESDDVATGPFPLRYSGAWGGCCSSCLVLLSLSWYAAMTLLSSGSENASRVFVDVAVVVSTLVAQPYVRYANIPTAQNPSNATPSTIRQSVSGLIASSAPRRKRMTSVLNEKLMVGFSMIIELT